MHTESQQDKASFPHGKKILMLYILRGSEFCMNT